MDKSVCTLCALFYYARWYQKKTTASRSWAFHFSEAVGPIIISSEEEDEKEAVVISSVLAWPSLHTQRQRSSYPYCHLNDQFNFTLKRGAKMKRPRTLLTLFARADWQCQTAVSSVTSCSRVCISLAPQSQCCDCGVTILLGQLVLGKQKSENGK